MGNRRFHDDNPKVVKIVLAALEEANAIIRNEPAKAAEIFVRLENSKLTVAQVEMLLKDPDIQFTIAPQNITKYTDFMAKVGTIRAAPDSWKDLFFPDIHQFSGS